MQMGTNNLNHRCRSQGAARVGDLPEDVQVGVGLGFEPTEPTRRPQLLYATWQPGVKQFSWIN